MFDFLWMVALRGTLKTRLVRLPIVKCGRHFLGEAMATDQLTKSEPPATPWRSMLHWIWRISRILLVPYLTLLLVLVWQEHDLVFRVVNLPQDNWQPDYLKFEDVTFSAADGTQLNGWYVPHENPRAIVLFAHGNVGNVSHRADKLRRMHEMRLSVFAFDYRGYGRSKGEPTEAGLYRDGRAARKWLADREQIPEEQIVLFGASLGGAVLIDLAAGDGARGLVLESTFDRLPDTAAHHFPWIPVRLLMRNRFPSIDKIGQYQGPLLQYHGELDNVVPYENGKRLFAAANEPKQLISIADAKHGRRRAPAYEQALDQFFDQFEQQPATAADNP